MNNPPEKVAIVTGGGQEIGREIAFRLASDGFCVVVWDVNVESSLETVRLIEAHSRGRAQCFPVDVASEAHVAKAVESVLESTGRIDVLVNNAGVAGPVREVEGISLEDWLSTININLTGTFLCCKHVVPVMKRSSSGVIVNVASVTGKRPMPLRTPYAASKMGIIGFTRSLAAEVGKWNIRVNAVCPGSVTGTRQKLVFEGIMQASGQSWDEVMKEKADAAALKRFVDPKHVAAVVSFLVQEDSAMISGQDINVCGGAVMY